VEHLEAALVTATKSDSVDEVPVRALSSSAYRFALDPTPSRTPCAVALRRAAVRVQLGLALVTAVMDQRNAEASYGISRTRS
jgi:hypothetical protein